MRQAQAVQAEGKEAEAIPLLEQAVAFGEQGLGPEALPLALALEMLGLLSRRHDDLARSETLYQRALAIREKAQGPEHPDVASTLTSLADIALAREALSRNANQLLFQEDLTVPLAALKSLIRAGEWQGELHQVTKDERKIIVQSRWTLMRDEKGEAKSILIINTDITEKKKLETQFFRSQRLENIGMLASGISHDLNNILSPIMMAVPMLRDCLSRPEDQFLLDTLGRSVRRGAELVSQILSFARGGEGEHKTIQLKHLLSDIETMVRETFPKNIQLEKNVDPELWISRGNATQIHQVLLNLCVNARDAMPGGGILMLHAKNSQIEESQARRHPEVKPGPCVVITVGDTGMGIASEMLKEIFEPFFTTKAPGKGTGLGLATVQGILKNHGGFVEVQSELGRGTQFEVWIPAIERKTAQPGEEKQVEMPAGCGELILVVDDEEAIQQIVRATLENYGYRVLSAFNGVEAVSLYKRHGSEIKAVLLDSTMPLMDGAATLRMLRQIAPDVSILGVSGLDSETGFCVGPGGVQAFLTKPYTAQELLVKLSAVLRGQAGLRVA